MMEEKLDSSITTKVPHIRLVEMRSSCVGQESLMFLLRIRYFLISLFLVCPVLVCEHCAT
eukprot:1214118-Amphidinium_carterae.1